MPDRLRYALGLFAVSLTACDVPSDSQPLGEPEFPTWSQKSDEVGMGLTPTRDQTVQIFDGYNAVVDSPVGRNCVLPEPGALELAQFAAGGDEISTEIKYIKSREELEEALGIDAQAKIKVGPLGGGGGLKISREYKSSDTSLSILLRSRHLYQVINQERHHLTDEALATLESDPARFVRECGTDYVAGVAYGAEMAMLIQIEAHSLEKKTEVQAKLEAAGIQAGPASIDPSLGTSFQSALANESVDIEVSLESRGFVPSVDLAVLGKLDADAFALAAQAQQELKDSVLADKCHDQGDAGPGTCGSGPARGYLANGARVSVPVGLLRLPFTRAANFPGDADIIEGIAEIKDQANFAMATLEAYARVYDMMVAVHSEEVGALLSSETPYDFTLYDSTDETLLPGDFTYNDLLAHAESWASAYEPTSGTEVRAVSELVGRCWTRAELGDFRNCLTRPEEDEEGREILATLAEYAQERVRPVYYTYAPKVHGFYHVDGKCSSGWRQPTLGEVSRLWFAVERNPDLPECTQTHRALETNVGAWYDDQNFDCSSDQGAFIERLADGEFRTGCYDDGGIFVNDMDLLVLCIPNAGPYGSNIFELPTPDDFE